jgi:hypothetical protein
MQRSATPEVRQSLRAAEQVVGDVLVEPARAQPASGRGVRALADRTAVCYKKKKLPTKLEVYI